MALQLNQILLLAIILFAALSLFLFVQHEILVGNIHIQNLPFLMLGEKTQHVDPTFKAKGTKLLHPELRHVEQKKRDKKKELHLNRPKSAEKTPSSTNEDHTAKVIKQKKEGSLSNPAKIANDTPRSNSVPLPYNNLRKDQIQRENTPVKTSVDGPLKKSILLNKSLVGSKIGANSGQSKYHDELIRMHDDNIDIARNRNHTMKTTVLPDDDTFISQTQRARITRLGTSKPRSVMQNSKTNIQEKKGKLVCHGKSIVSEIIYWKDVEGDGEYESPITPHHGIHHDRYITFEYDHGGWNNVRMGVECLIMIAHAMGRTLVVPPPQHLYLLGRSHKIAGQKKPRDEMGFEDFFDIDLLRGHKGFHILHMKEFLEKEACQGGLKGGKLPPRNSSSLWGRELWKYMDDVADERPSWMGKFFGFSDRENDWHLDKALADPLLHTTERMKHFAGDSARLKSIIYYDDKLQNAHHIHLPGDQNFRLLQHFYAFAFFANAEQQSFYRRFIRDYMRYKDEIQCAGAELVDRVRADALKLAPHHNGSYYALHIRRGDLQFKEVKIGADQMIKNLRFLNGTSIIPDGALVYMSTDDPDGVCKGCLVQRKPCEEYTPGKKPPGCPEDPSWDAMRKAGWKLKFLRDYLEKDYKGPPSTLQSANPNTHGQIESIVCSRATAFAGTYFSTFTGYIHRLRGYHGLAETTYYHSTGHVFALQGGKNTGHGWTREYRSGWTDDASGEGI